MGNLQIARKFFVGRKSPELGDAGTDGLSELDFARCANVPATIAAAITSGKATLIELDTHYGVKDLYDLLEIAAVESHNRRLISEARAE